MLSRSLRLLQHKARFHIAHFLSLAHAKGLTRPWYILSETKMNA
jgi:hypothetical protein